jgi:hypothetical protein
MLAPDSPNVNQLPQDFSRSLDKNGGSSLEFDLLKFVSQGVIRANCTGCSASNCDNLNPTDSPHILQSAPTDRVYNVPEWSYDVSRGDSSMDVPSQFEPNPGLERRMPSEELPKGVLRHVAFHTETQQE